MRLDIETNPTAPTVLENRSFEDLDAFHDTDRLLKRGVFAAQSGDRDTARKLLTQVVAHDPACEDAWMWLASMSDYPEELLAFLNRVLAINPENERATEWHSATMSLMAKTFVRRAVAAHHESDLELAEQCIEQALTYDQNCVDAWMWRASIAEDEGTQIKLLEKVLEIEPGNSDAADAIRQIEERREQERVREEERRLEEERLAAEAARVEEERRLEEERLAAEAARLEEERLAEEARLAEEQRVAALFGEAKAAALSGDNAKALVLIQAYLASHANDAAAWVLCSHLSQTVEEKIESLKRALAIDPDNAAARSGYEFLSSMAAPAVAVSGAAETDEGFDAHIQDTAGPSEQEVAAAEAITEESIPEVDGCIGSVEPTADYPQDELGSEAEANGDPYATVEYTVDPMEITEISNVREDPSFELSIEDTRAPDASPGHEGGDPAADACPFCGHHNAAKAFECDGCRVKLSLSDLEMVLTNSAVDRSTVSRAVVRMEAEWNERELTVGELTDLAVGHLNLGSFEAGRKYLQEALIRDPNNVVLAGQLNALAIRLDEIERQREINDGRPKGKTILVVDDSATVRKLISGKLEKSGHHVVCAADGVEALEKMAEKVPDLVLLDITMPRMDGYEVCKQIRANSQCSHVPVVMISGKDGFFDKVRGRMAGTTGYVTKPFGPETLMRALETYLLPDVPVHEPVTEAEYEAELEPAV